VDGRELWLFLAEDGGTDDRVDSAQAATGASQAAHRSGPRSDFTSLPRVMPAAGSASDSVKSLLSRDQLRKSRQKARFFNPLRLCAFA